MSAISIEALKKEFNNNWSSYTHTRTREEFTTDKNNIVRFRIKPKHEKIINKLIKYHGFKNSSELMRYLLEEENKLIDYRATGGL